MINDTIKADTVFLLILLLIQGSTMVKRVEKSLPVKKAHQDKIIKKFHEGIHAIIHGFFIIAILEGVIGAITFWLFGVSSPIIWGSVIAFLAFVPFIGGAFIWVPAVIIKFSNGMIGPAIGIVIGGLIISYIDTFVKPKVIGDKAEINPAIILLGLLGGLKLIGIIGIIIGPIILSLLVMFIKTFAKER